MGSAPTYTELFAAQLIRERQATAYLSQIFSEQRAFVEDPAKQVANLSGRRSGKSHGNAFRLKAAADKHPGEESLYVSTSKNNSRRIVGRAITEAARRWGWSVELGEVDGRLMAKWGNGARTWLAGAQHRADFEIFRGFKFSEVIVDEAQLYPWLNETVDDILEATLGDLDGSLVLSGTPSAIPVGFFHAVTTGEDLDEHGRPIPKWSTHGWTCAENVFFRGGKGAEYLAELLKRRGWDTSHPTYQREWLGRWVRDDGALVFPYAAERNAFSALPEPSDPSWIRVLGVDLGSSRTEPTTAFTILAYRQRQPTIYVLKSYKRSAMIPSAKAAEVFRLHQEHRFGAIVVDDGGLGGDYIEEWRTRYGLPVEAARKADKAGRVELARGDMLSGVIKFDPVGCADLLDEMVVAQWDEQRALIDDRFPDHAIDSWIYGHGKARSYYRDHLPKPEAEPPPGTPAAMAREQAEHKAKIQREVMKKMREKAKKGGFR